MFKHLNNQNQTPMKKMLILLCAIFLSLSAMAQERMVTGRVTGKDGKPIPGVHIAVKRAPAGTVSDEDGKYSIALPDGGGGGGSRGPGRAGGGGVAGGRGGPRSPALWGGGGGGYLSPLLCRSRHSRT